MLAFMSEQICFIDLQSSEFGLKRTVFVRQLEKLDILEFENISFKFWLPLKTLFGANVSKRQSHYVIISISSVCQLQ